MYIVVEKNYKTLSNREVYKTENRYEACAKVEELSEEFVKSKEGTANSELYEHTKSNLWKTHPQGYFMVRDSKFNKITIVCKEFIPGVLYGNFKISEVLSYEVVDLVEKIKFENSKFYTDIRALILKDDPQRLHNILDEIEEIEEEESVEQTESAEDEK